VPGLFSVPALRNHSIPFSKISGTIASVSTLLTIVGERKRPSTAGKGGLILG
jgi:hypothetical protein